MKKELTFLKITACVYVIIYVCKSFIIWDITNPFSWIYNMPTYSNDDRLTILFFFFYCIVVKIVVYNHIKK